MDPLTTALIGLAGGAVALFGQVIVQRLIAGFNRAKDRDSLLREKSEALVTALLEHDAWFRANCTPSNLSVFLTDSPIAASPLLKAQMLQRLYFPGLAPPVARVALVLIEGVAAAFAIQCADKVGAYADEAALRKELMDMRSKNSERVTEAVDAVCEQMHRLLLT